MKLITITRENQNDIIEFLRDGNYSLSNTHLGNKNFKRKYFKYVLESDSWNHLFFRKSSTILLWIFCVEDVDSKINLIEIIHFWNRHLDRDRLRCLLKDKIYNFSKEDILVVLRTCP